MRDMMSRAKNCNVVVLCTLLLLIVGCEPKDPFTTQGKVEDPHWVLSVENDMTASMTAIVRVGFSAQAGTLAAFVGDECCGIAKYDADYDLYWLYISPATDKGSEVQLRFYSPELKRVYEADSTFPFRNDTQLGSVSEPYSPGWEVGN